jgi:Phage integrase, N-terminal SAM-like domain
MSYKYQLYATFRPLLGVFSQISGRIRVLIRNFSMDTQLPLGATVHIETLEQAVDLFVTDGMPAHNLSPQTRKNYRHDLVDLLAFLKNRGASNLADISLRHLEGYQAEMDRRDYAASTRNRKTHTIKSLFHFLHRLGITSHNIADKLIPPPVQKHEPAFCPSQNTSDCCGPAHIGRAMQLLLSCACKLVCASQNWQSSNCTI